MIKFKKKILFMCMFLNFFFYINANAVTVYIPSEYVPGSLPFIEQIRNGNQYYFLLGYYPWSGNYTLKVMTKASYDLSKESIAETGIGSLGLTMKYSYTSDSRQKFSIPFSTLNSLSSITSLDVQYSSPTATFYSYHKTLDESATNQNLYAGIIIDTNIPIVAPTVYNYVPPTEPTEPTEPTGDYTTILNGINNTISNLALESTLQEIKVILQNQNINLNLSAVTTGIETIIVKIDTYGLKLESILLEIKNILLERNNEDIVERLDRILESYYTLDRDNDYPLLYAIASRLDTLIDIMNGGVDGSSINGFSRIVDSISKLNTTVSLYTTRDLDTQTNLYLQHMANSLADMTGGTFGNSLYQIAKDVGDMNVNFASNLPSLGTDLTDVVAKLNALLLKLQELLDKMIGSEEQLLTSVDNMQDAFDDLMNYEALHVGDGVKDSVGELYTNFSETDLPKISATVIPGHAPLVIFSLDAWGAQITMIRSLLVAILYISMFLYFIRSLIPKLKL